MSSCEPEWEGTTDWEGPHPCSGVAPVANGVRQGNERHRDDRRNQELAGSISKGDYRDHGDPKGQVDHAHGATVSVLTGCRYHGPFLQQGTVGHIRQLAGCVLKCMGERMPTSLGTTWAFTQPETMMTTYRLSGGRVVRLSDGDSAFWEQ